MGKLLSLIALFFLNLSLFPFPLKAEIVIDPGHGGIDSGAAVGPIEEKTINLEVAKVLSRELQNKGYRVILTREADEAPSDYLRNGVPSRHRRDLMQRERIGDYFKPYVFVSLHVNAGAAGNRGGVVLYQKNGESYLLARILQDRLNGITGVAKDPVRGEAYYLLNRVGSPAVIVEMGYLTNPEERAKLVRRDYQMEIAEALAEGIDEYFRLYGKRNGNLLMRENKERKDQ